MVALDVLMPKPSYRLVYRQLRKQYERETKGFKIEMRKDMVLRMLGKRRVL